MTPRVREILNWYGADNPGSLTNLARIMNHGRLAGSGKMVILPVDQGFEHGPTRSFGMNPDSYDPAYHFELAIESGCNAYAAPLGALEVCAREFAGEIPLILKVNNSDVLAKTESPISALTSSVDAALRLGCAGIGFTIYPGSGERKQAYEEIARLTEQAKRAGLAVVVWSYARGANISKTGETGMDVISYSAHIACQLGAHIIKVKPPTAFLEQPEAKKVYEGQNVKIEKLSDRIRNVVQSCFNGKRIVIFSGGEPKTTDALMEEVRELARGGAFGSIMGRNAFQRPKKDAIKLLQDVMDTFQAASDTGAPMTSNEETETNLEPEHENAHRENPLRVEKRRKLHELKAAGVNPYPYSFDRTHSSEEVRKAYGHLNSGEKSEEGKVFRLAGRVMSRRDMGKASFFNIQDQAGTFQVYIRPAEVPGDGPKCFQLLDLGDIVGVEGRIFKTKTGELSLHADTFTMLCKTLEPLPEKFHGIADIELKYRHRHLDLISDPESRRVFETRSKIIREIRAFLDSRGFLEVETPILQPLYGGAAARPFKTHHHTLDMTLFMKISPELYLKRLIVGGFEKVYDINKNFRNEGIDRTHNPEFTMVEWYEAYTDYFYQMKQFEELVAHLATVATGSTKVTYQGRELDFTPPWRRLSVCDAIKEFAKYDVTSMSDADIMQACIKHGAKKDDPKFKAFRRGEYIAHLFELTCEEHLWQPIFITDHPVEISPLTKKHRTIPGLVERFEPFAAFMEIGNSYSELNDPEEQRARLEEQESKRVVDQEAQPMDEDFLHAIDTGMPPTGGVGLGVERIVMLLTDRSSIRDIILFPTMKIKG